MCDEKTAGMIQTPIFYFLTTAKQYVVIKN